MALAALRDTALTRRGYVIANKLNTSMLCTGVSRTNRIWLAGTDGTEQKITIIVKRGCQKELIARMNRNAREPRVSMGEHKDSESGHACLHTGKCEGDASW